MRHKMCITGCFKSHPFLICNFTRFYRKNTFHHTDISKVDLLCGNAITSTFTHTHTHTHMWTFMDDENNKIEVEVSVVRGKCTFVHLDIKSRHIDIKNMYSCDVWGLLMLLMLFLIWTGDVFAVCSVDDTGMEIKLVFDEKWNFLGMF